MFTGLVEGVGMLAAREHVGRSGRGGDARLRIAVGTLPFEGVQLGESISVNGVCLTVVAFDDRNFEADASNETLALTTLGSLPIGRALNLERAMLPTDRLGGHLVSGHVDGVGSVSVFAEQGESHLLQIEAPPELAPFLAYKGSVTVQGVSLTINAVNDTPRACTLSINLIPHTLVHTTLQHLRTGSRVNLEIDMLARYVQRMLALQHH